MAGACGTCGGSTGAEDPLCSECGAGTPAEESHTAAEAGPDPEPQSSATISAEMEVIPGEPDEVIEGVPESVPVEE